MNEENKDENQRTLNSIIHQALFTMHCADRL